MNNSITNRQIFFIIFAVVVGYGIVNLPNDAAILAGTGAWIPLAINTVIISLLAYIVSYIGYYHENQTLYEYSQKLMGKALGKIITIIYIIHFLNILSYLVKSYSEIVTLIFLNRTPVWAISISLLLIIGYALTKNLKTIARLTEIYVSLVIIGFIVIQIIMTTQGKIINIRPLFGSEDLITYVKASFELFVPFVGLEIIMFIPINKIKNKGIMKYSILSIVFVGMLYIFVVESTISVVGVEDLVYYDASIFKVLKGIDLHSLEILQRPDGFYVTFWTMNLFCDICIIAYLILDQCIKFFKNTSKYVIVFFIITITFILSQFLKTPIQMDIVVTIIKNFGILTLIIIPSILLIITKVKKNEK